jgi:hypothetical protein
MSVEEDVKTRQSQTTNAASGAESKKVLDEIRKRNADLANRQQKAKKKLASLKSLYDTYINELATGKFAIGENQGKKFTPAELQKRKSLAEDTAKEISSLNKLISQKPEPVRLPTAPKPQNAKPTAGPTGTVTLQATETAKQTAAKEATTKTPVKTPSKTPVKTPEKTPTETPVVETKPGQDLQTILQKTEFWYDLPDYIFKTVPDLGKLLVQAVNEGWDDEKFLSQAKLTTWWQQNSAPIRTRIIARAKFNELQSAGQDASKTEYALDTATIKRNVQTRARQLGSNLDENAINQIVARIYDGFLENDTVAIDSFIAPYIGKVTSIVGTGLGIQPTGYSGQALQNYQALQAVAKANGLTIKDILPKFSVLPGQNLDDIVLQKLATGELDINRLAQDARMIAAQGTPDYVKGLLQQGYDLEQIYAPYKNVMAQILEVNPDEIQLNDNTLRSAIGQDKEMNIFDFKKALRKDSRWQYTENAREEVANSVLGVLRDFGFQG